MELSVPTSRDGGANPWREEQHDDGTTRLVLDPPLEVIEPEAITLEMMQRGCTLLGIDADDVWAGRPIELPEWPDVAASEAFFEMVVVNHDAYPRLALWQWSRAKSVLAVACDHFINASRQPSSAGRTS